MNSLIAEIIKKKQFFKTKFFIIFINFNYSIFQFREKRITLRICVGKNTKHYNNDMKIQHSS